MVSEDLHRGEADLAEVLGELARSLEAESSLDELLSAITASSVTTIPGVDYAGITLVKDRRELQSVAPTDDLVVEADRAQEVNREGPCLDAIREHDTFRVDDLENDQRWPRYRPAALELGVRSSLSFQLFTEARTLGALNLYSRRAHAFDEDAEQIGLLFAAHAAVALRGAQQVNELRKALHNRDTIGMAKGILIERHKISPDRAFGMLVRTSQQTHVKLHEVAEFLVRSGSESPN